MPEYWNDTITLYNKHEDTLTGGIFWYKHILKNCFVKRTNNKVNISGVQLHSNDVIVRIPEQKDYVSAFEWQKLSNYDRNQKLTLQVGDLIFLGEVNEEIDEYTDGIRSSDLIAKYSALGSVSVNAVNINDNLPNGHYYVRCG